MHGAKGGAPAGNRNAMKHGLYCAQTIHAIRYVKAMAKQARELAEAIE